MDAKFLSNKPLSLPTFSGPVLLGIVTIGILTSSLALDSAAGRLGQVQSLTLPLTFAWLGTAAAGFVVLPILRSLKTGQFIREEGPKAHLKKAGTPTMGGIFFIPVGVVVAMALSGFAGGVVAAGLLTLSYGFIGWLDDWQVLRRKSNKGITPKTKLALQIAFSVMFCLWVLGTQPANLTTVALPLGISLPLGFLFWPLAGFVLVAESNATNLTDGLDGLMGGTGAIALLGLAALVAPTNLNLMVFCASMSGACLGFLLYNRNPAKVFMGDTGSLALGGALAAAGILSGNLFGLLVVTLLFFAETVSVIIQVSYYKATKGADGVGKRFFRMAPLHHHFELSGWTELQVVGVFYAVTALLVSGAIATSGVF